jgi:hypothetical protein
MLMAILDLERGAMRWHWYWCEFLQLHIRPDSESP